MTYLVDGKNFDWEGYFSREVEETSSLNSQSPRVNNAANTAFPSSPVADKDEELRGRIENLKRKLSALEEGTPYPIAAIHTEKKHRSSGMLNTPTPLCKLPFHPPLITVHNRVLSPEPFLINPSTPVSTSSDEIPRDEAYPSSLKRGVSFLLDRIQHFLIGDLVSAPDRFEAAEKGFIHQSLGLLGSRVIWKPKSESELKTVIEELDAKKGSRCIYQAGQRMAGSRNEPSFSLAYTGSDALIHRREVVNKLKPSKIAEKIWSLILNKKTLHHPMQAVAEEVFGIEMKKSECEKIIDLAFAFKTYSASSVPQCLLRFIPRFKEHQKRCQKCIEDMLEREIGKIQQRLHKINPANIEQEGLVVQRVFEKMQRGEKMDLLHKDSDIKSLVLLLFALDNLIDIQKIKPSFSETEKIYDEVVSVKVVRDDGTLDSKLLMDKQRMPLLESAYQKALADSFSDQMILLRYVENGMKCGEHFVPSRSLLVIMNPDGSAPFSTGRRVCPGRFVAEAIFKTYLIGQFVVVEEEE